MSTSRPPGPGDVAIRQIVLPVTSKAWPVKDEEELQRVASRLTARACRDMGINYEQVLNFEWVVTQDPSEIDGLSWIPTKWGKGRRQQEMRETLRAFHVNQRDQAKAYLSEQDGNIVAVGWVQYVYV